MVKAKIKKTKKQNFSSLFISISWTKQYFVRKQKIIFLENTNMSREIKAERAKSKREFIYIFTKMKPKDNVLITTLSTS